MQNSLKIKLINLYLYHVYAFVNNEKVKTFIGQITLETVDEDPNEWIMRRLESHADIGEIECVTLRGKFIDQLKNFRADLLFEKMEETFQYFILAENALVNDWLETYPEIRWNGQTWSL